MSTPAARRRINSTVDEAALARSIAGCFAHARVILPNTKNKPKKGVRTSTYGKILGAGPSITSLSWRLCEPDWRRYASLRHIGKITGTSEHHEQTIIVESFLRGLRAKGALSYHDGAWVLRADFIAEQQGYSAELSKAHRSVG